MGVLELGGLTVSPTVAGDGCTSSGLLRLLELSAPILDFPFFLFGHVPVHCLDAPMRSGDLKSEI